MKTLQVSGFELDQTSAGISVREWKVELVIINVEFLDPLFIFWRCS